MDLCDVTEVYRGDDLPAWRPGDAWLAGGTYLFSEPQPRITRLIDLTALGWTPLTVRADGLEIAATCTIAELVALDCPPAWGAVPLMRGCAEALLASAPVWNVATVGGNLATALPAGAMIALTVALDGVCTIWGPRAESRRMPVADLVLGPRRTALAPGEVLRSVHLPVGALRAPTAMRQMSLRPMGRSAALLVARREPRRMVLTVTAATLRPVVLELAPRPDAAQLRAALDDAVAPDLYVDDVHGDADWRRHLTLTLAEEIRTELAGKGDG